MVGIAVLMVVGIWGLVVIGCLVATAASQAKQWQAERKDLLNRIMSRDYREFAANEHKEPEGVPMKVVPLEELRRELQEDHRDPLGMPV